MKIFTLPALGAGVLFAAVVVVPFLPVAKMDVKPFALEARIHSSVAGRVVLYYDIGEGYREDHSSVNELRAGETHSYWFRLPAGDYRSLRLDPLDGPGRVRVEGPVRIVGDGGRVVRDIPLERFRPLQQIAEASVRDRQLDILVSPAANDPQLRVEFSPPLAVRLTLGERARGLVPRAVAVFAVVAFLLWACGRSIRVRRLATAALAGASQFPNKAAAVVAAVAVVVSAYPIVFLGKSHVSPNFGTTLLYDAFPTLPGYSSAVIADGNGSDVGAMIWQNVPYAVLQSEALRQGDLPLWNRHTLTGTPLLAQGQSMLGDPLHWLVIAARGAAWAWDVKFLLAKWLFAWALGLLVLAVARDSGALPGPAPARGVSGAVWGPALIVTAAAPFMGFFVYRINHPAIFSVAYAPWVLYAWIRLSQAPGRRPLTGWAGGLLVANAALLTSGTAKEACVLLLQMNGAGLALALSRAEPWRTRWVKVGAAAAAGVCLLMMACPVWLTFLDTVRAAFTGSMHAAADQIQPALLLGAFDELFFRPLTRGDLVFNPSLNLLLLLGLLYFLVTLRLHARHRSVVALGAVTLVSMAVVFGVVPAAFIVEVPLLGRVGHIENCFLGGLLVFWSVLAGVGFRTAAARLGGPEGRADLFAGGLCLLALVGAWVGFRQAAHRVLHGPESTFSLLRGGEVIPVSPFIWLSLAAMLIAAAAGALMARKALQRGRAGPAGAVLLALCAVILLWRHGMHAPAVGFETYVVRPPARASFDSPSPAIEFVRGRQHAEPGRVFGLQGNLTPAWNAVYGLEAIHGPDALQPMPLRELIDVSPLKWSSAWRLYSGSGDIAAARPFLDALNVRYYFDLPGNPPPPGPKVTPLFQGDLNVGDSPTAWPRAFFTDRLATFREPADLMRLIMTGDGRPFAAVPEPAKAENRGLTVLGPDLDGRSIVAAREYRLSANRTEFTVKAPGPGLVVLTEAWWPDAFQVDVDGRPAPIVRVNHAFKGVRIDTPGDHRVTFTYWPKNFTLTLGLSAIGTVLAVGAVAWGLRAARTA